MKVAVLLFAMVSVSTSFAARHQDAEPVDQSAKPRVYLQSQSKGNNRNAARDQSMEMSKDFEETCPGVRITINQQMADYTVLLNHIEVGLFVRDNQFQLADRNGDLLSKTREGGSIRNGVQKVCNLIVADWAKNKPQNPPAEPAAVAPAPASAAAPAAAPVAAVQAPTAQLAIASSPNNAEIEIDGGYVGNTPSAIDATPGEHLVTIHKKGFVGWERKVKVTGGNINITAELEPMAEGVRSASIR